MADVTQELRQVNQKLRRTLSGLGGLDSPEIKAMAKELRRSIIKVLSVSGGGRVTQSLSGHRLYAVGGTPSGPGEPPRRQTGQLARSIAYGIAGAQFRVGAIRFTAAMLQFGVQSTRGARRSAGTRRGRRTRGTLVQRTVTIAPRPYLEPALELAKDAMGEAFAEVAGARISSRASQP